jgi:hypothetical protein
MASFGQETITVQRQRFVLRTPTNAVELQKMFSAAFRARAGLGSPSDLPDDALWVTVEDDDIVISWEELVHDAG